MIKLEKCKYHLCKSKVLVTDENLGLCSKSCQYKMKAIDKKQETKEAIYKYMGSKCVRCETEDQRVFCFHHVDPSQKKFNISAKMNLKFDLLKIELDKCIILCENCHAIVHVEKDSKYIQTVKFCFGEIDDTSKGFTGTDRCVSGSHEIYRNLSKKRLRSLTGI
jgi:hypothetical protein